MPPFRRRLKGSSERIHARDPRRKAFQGARLNALEQNGENGSAVNFDNLSPADDASDTPEGSSDGDDIQELAANPYNTLLKSLNTQSHVTQHRSKRRKLDGFPKSLPSENSPDTFNVVSNEATDEIAGTGEDDEVESRDEEENGSSDPEDDVETPWKNHLEVDDERLNFGIQELLSKSLPPSRSNFMIHLKAVATGPSNCKARKPLSKTILRGLSSSFKIKAKIQQRAAGLFPDGLTPLASSLATPIFNLQDLLFCERTSLNAKEIQRILCVHVLNYILKTRDQVLKNNAEIARMEDDQLLEHRDQGFTRPKVLILLPTRQACYRFVDLMITLYDPEQQENRKRFNESFSSKDDDLSQEKPADFRDLFGGNDDDLFRIGIKFTRKTVKFFSQFYNSDIIFASPLGLRMAMTRKDTEKEDFDFLSSIELMVVDHADALLQQNWDHVEHVLTHLNLQPKEHHGCDFSRVRSWYLDGNARFLRQTIILCSFLTPELNQVCSRHMCNVEGTLKISPEVFDGAIVGLGLSMKQTFLRFDALTPQKEPDARFKAFTTSILPSVIKAIKAGTQDSRGILIFIPSYMDFVRVRNFMASSTTAQDVSFGAISEYTTASEVSRARSHFVSGRHSVLLYSGRAHHFRRYKLKGVKRVIMYSLPDNPLFYTEVAGDYLARSVSEGLIAPEDVYVKSLFCRWDVLKLERVVGTKRVASMLNNKGGETFDFV